MPKRPSTAELVSKDDGDLMNPGAVIDHQFVVAAYIVTWTLQLGYVVWLFFKWRAQKRKEARLTRISR